MIHVIVDQLPGSGDAHPITGDWSLGLFYGPEGGPLWVGPDVTLRMVTPPASAPVQRG